VSRLRKKPGLKLLAVVLAAQGAALSFASANDEGPTSCEAAFYEAVDAGYVVSVNGLAIEADFTSFFVTGLLDEHARIVRRQCIGGMFAVALPVFPLHDFQDYQPTLSLDGSRLCFTSTRPITGDVAVRQNAWCASSIGERSDAVPIAALVSPYWDGHAIEIEPGKILYASERADDGQMVDIFEYDLGPDSSGPTRVEQLSSPISDNDMAFDRHTQTLAFSRYDPATKDIDIYISTRTEGKWSKPVRVPALATPNWEMSPAFTPDGKYLLYKRGNEPFRRVLVSEILSSIRP